MAVIYFIANISFFHNFIHSFFLSMGSCAYMNARIRNLVSGMLAALIALPAFGARPTVGLRLLYWNIQNGMWADQCRNYDDFVRWVDSVSPDVCVWCEAQSIYKSGMAEPLTESERYLTDGWPELASRYGHRYLYVGGHRDNYPQVITSRYPIRNMARIVGNGADSVVSHGAGWARIEVAGNVLNIVTLHTWPQAYAYRAADREKSRAEHGGDAYRRMEIEYVCRHTIGTDDAAAGQLWMMMGDFNSRSRKDNHVYGYPLDDSRLWVHDYVLENTPYVDAIAERHGQEFRTTTAGRSRIDFVYCTPPLYDRIVHADVVYDSYTEPVRDSLGLSNFYYPSDHRPIVVDFELKKKNRRR